jgi:hypothetical protein
MDWVSAFIGGVAVTMTNRRHLKAAARTAAEPRWRVFCAADVLPTRRAIARTGDRTGDEETVGQKARNPAVSGSP